MSVLDKIALFVTLILLLLWLLQDIANRGCESMSRMGIPSNDTNRYFTNVYLISRFAARVMGIILIVLVVAGRVAAWR